MPRVKPQVYLLKEYPGTVREVGATSTGDIEIVVDAGKGGVLHLRGLTVEEARAAGSFIYRPAVVRVTVTEDRTAVPDVAKRGA